MKLPLKPHHLPVRLATGAFIFNSGWDKRDADEATAQGLHGMAAGAYPFLDKVAPADFVKAVSAGEMALGASLMLPIVPSRLAGAGLTAFAAGLLGVYLRTPGLRREGSVRPTPDGIGMAKDSFMLGAGLTLMMDRPDRDCD
ncbi:hypothetical protein DFP74_4281 [Nocardiopsis sp. Huas11]|uniref:hypothetical protein n=1 Tax=Nocardiopsis sp. Huas11 TaxID=2183912 RepID=UPI000EB37D7C|nr:hypothetical protein [Nocardiopsis sp. Huas11]RKS08569.1 hypothetical protein DFP74_4281 [Nocardiopsis sp. Huas11]